MGVQSCLTYFLSIFCLSKTSIYPFTFLGFTVLSSLKLDFLEYSSLNKKFSYINLLLMFFINQKSSWFFRFEELVPSLEQLKNEIENLKNQVKGFSNEQIVFCHNDLLLANYVFDEKNGNT